MQNYMRITVNIYNSSFTYRTAAHHTKAVPSFQVMAPSGCYQHRIPMILELRQGSDTRVRARCRARATACIKPLPTDEPMLS